MKKDWISIIISTLGDDMYDEIENEVNAKRKKIRGLFNNNKGNFEKYILNWFKSRNIELPPFINELFIIDQSSREDEKFKSSMELSQQFFILAIEFEQEFLKAEMLRIFFWNLFFYVYNIEINY